MDMGKGDADQISTSEAGRLSHSNHEVEKADSKSTSLIQNKTAVFLLVWTNLPIQTKSMSRESTSIRRIEETIRRRERRHPSEIAKAELTKRRKHALH